MVFFVLSKRQKKKSEGGSLDGPYATAYTFVKTVVLSVQTLCLHVSAEEIVALQPLIITHSSVFQDKLAELI